MSKEKVKYYVEGVSYPALNLEQITETIINEFKTFYKHTTLTRDIHSNNVMVEADGNRFKLEVNYNWRAKEFCIDRVEILN